MILRVAHMFSAAFSVLDVRDPRKPHVVNHIPVPAKTWPQTHDDLY
jgi:hypothetical protein